MVFMEFRFHGRGGQGVVTASQLLVNSAFKMGFQGQSIPMFGAERRGAPVEAYARISDTNIRRHSQVYSPDFVSVFDPKLLQVVNVVKGLKPNGTIILNSPNPPDKFTFNGFRVYTLDASGIAIKLGLYFAGFPAVNTAMVAAIAKATKILSLDSILSSIRDLWSGRIGELNVEAAKLAYDSIVGD